MAKLFFLYLAAAIIVFSILVITRRNPVHSAIFILLLFFHIAGLYLTLNAEFLAAVQIIIYAGAILVLYLFVMLLLNLKEEIGVPQFFAPWHTAVAAAIALLVVSFFVLWSFPLGQKGTVTREVIMAETNTKIIGKTMFTEYLYPFEILSVILLVAIIGAVVLAKKKVRG